MRQLLSHVRFKVIPSSSVEGMVRFKVEPEFAPYLVTSRDGLQWVTSPSTDGEVPTAFRLVNPHRLFTEMLQEIEKAGVEFEWGNVLPLTPKGLESAKAHLRLYGVEEVDVYKNGVDLDGIEVSWVPAGRATVLPKDKSWVGCWGRVSRQKLVGIASNVARGVAILR